ncbi:hypothetical protein BDZ94DRAFT_1317952 [Collybia nuda]|uniref:Ras GEF n=1 Tax=Collybia nuda TaxID=64659 RepID=A0A9P5YG30_9AGAR|nr:hypothetical protein BDZ94DRAFT_1317952 [Collybia nuda]
MSSAPNSPTGEDGPFRLSTYLATTSHSTQPSAPGTSLEPSSFPQPEPVHELDSSITNLLLPLPPSLFITSSTSATSSDPADGSQNGDSLTQEFAKADITVAPDGSFIETSSGLAAREIKIHWDQHIGVGKSVRSPYAITAFVNQHGKQMYRVGRREMTAPAASAAEVEERVTQSMSPSDSSSSPQAKRRSRISMHALAPSIFRNGSNSSGRSQVPAPQSSGPRKLRKTRSIPDLSSTSTNTSSSVDRPSQHTGSASIITGRAHSHSVTGADVSPFSIIASARRRDRDLFGETMEWNAPPTSASTSFSTHSLSLPRQAPNEHYEPSTSPAIIIHPFGLGVTFDSPSRKPAIDFLPMPRLLREMQSFESGLTARQPEHHRRTGQDASEAYPFDDTTRPPSALRQHDSSLEQTMIQSEVPAASPSPETTALSRYSTDVFDVLQTYRGLPLLEKLSLGTEETTVIKMSLSADDTAVPRDDPRFVIWGEIQQEQDHDDNSVSHESFAESSANSSMSKRRNTRGKAPESPNTRLSSGESTKKVIIAATIERWIAQLTSDLNYDELLDFFLTYRTYVSAVDLCHLLICRFHWALQPATSPRDERTRRIVRVRTFVAMRYWVVTFFTVDFLPNRELRLLLASWLNTLIRDPVLEKHNDGRNIVRKLMKVAKECKQVHTRSPTVNKPRASSAPSKPTPGNKEQLFGAGFAAATQKPSIDDDESDVDLDFLQDDSTSDIPSGYLHDSANAHLSAAHMHGGAAGFAPTRPVSIPFSSFSILQRTEHAPGPAEFDSPFVQNAAALPIPHGALSRAFVNTIGRLGRWRRVLNSRSVSRTSLGGCADVSAFDLEGNIPRELLNANGGAKRFLGVVGPPPKSFSTKPTVTDSRNSVSASTPKHVPEIHGASGNPPLPTLSIPTPYPSAMIDESSDALTTTSEMTSDDTTRETSPPSSPTTETESIISDQGSYVQRVNLPNSSESNDRAVSFRSSSTDSLGTPLTHGGLAPTFPPLAEPQWRFPIASIEDVDLSDTSSDMHVSPASPPGLRRQPRKLPFRREFEFVRRPDTVSSMGLTSHESMMSTASSAMSSPSGVGFGGNIAVWQMNALIDSLSNDEETGDVEDALRRLEGQINPREQQEKASKVDGWVRTMRERLAAGDYEDEEFRIIDDEDNEQEDPVSGTFYDHDSDRPHSISVLAPSQTESSDSSNMDGTTDSMDTPVPTQTSHMVPPPPGLDSPTRPEAKPAPEDAVPLEILQSRLSSRPSTPSSRRPSMLLFGTSESTRSHRSFILGHQTAELARHFAMIDRELFMGVKFEELVLDDWMNCPEVDVLDWAQYLKDRARWKAENRYHDKTSALAAVRARFNLLANFTISEIVLTQPSERPVLVGKFIRIAWKAYLMTNFSTLVAIITALQNEWVTKAMRKPSWGRVGLWEQRMFKDLKAFTTNSEDFKYIRQSIKSVIEAKTLDTNTHAPSVISGGGGADTQLGKGKLERQATSPACIPFIGIYLSQLKQHSKLPDLIDPTAPNEAVGVNPETANFDAPAHPEVFSTLTPLPVSMHLEPLINVHKQRRIAGVIKSLVAGQHLASRVKFDIDKRLFQKCLRLRGLDSDMLQRALAASD